MKIKLSLTVLHMFAVSFVLYYVAQVGLAVVVENSWFIASYLAVVLTLPIVFARGILGKKTFGIFTAVSFLYYPIGYFILYYLATRWGVGMGEGLQVWSYSNVLIWNVALFLSYWREPASEQKKHIKDFFYFTPLISLYLVVVYFFVRSPGSVLALDYLQHQTVVNGMKLGETLCLLPVHCSNLFLQQGYTTFYHTVLGSLASFPGLSHEEVFYLLDFVYPLVAAAAVYAYTKHHLQPFWSLIATAISLFVFTNGAYEMTFFIPQTFSFLIFLMLLNEEQLWGWKIVVGALLLVVTHFIMGTYLLFILLLRELFRKEDRLSPALDPSSMAAYVLLLVPAFVMFVANYLGFSFEQTFQKGALEVVGTVINVYFPDNVHNLMSLQGIGTALFVMGMFYLAKKEQKPTWLRFVIAFMATDLVVYFLAPTYAHKFLIGSGLIFGLVISKLLEEIKLEKLSSVIVVLLLISSYGMNFIMQYQNYARFFVQKNGETSAIVKSDTPLIEHLDRNPQGCTIVSDPYTQLTLAAFTNSQTAKGHYLLPSSRRTVNVFMRSPRDATYESLMDISELEGSDSVCILYSSRLESVLDNESNPWLDVIYALPVDSSNPITDSTSLEAYLLSSGWKVVYKDEHYILFRDTL